MAKQLIKGVIGSLEIAVNEINPTAPYVVVCHPHPLYGGTMDNKVVTMTAKAYEDLGCNSIRFNYRGVGESDGIYGKSLGEVADALAIVTWLNKEKAVTTLYFAGFSFGAYIAAQAASDTQAQSQMEVRHLLMIAPSVLNSPFENVTPISLDTTIIMGDADEVVPYGDVRAWAEQQYPPLEMITMEGAGHFFHGRLTELKQQIKRLFNTEKLG
ncbi:Dot/Icm type IV secretion system effector CoxH3 [Oceaniserpentilla sp. 4NH20-0058]|uniref:alpha/beta hydrolase n=1 Tax=Oceaniserpentilla sp. 4NH20-0058 TaxID=3127660 RepID=UPI0031074DCE